MVKLYKVNELKRRVIVDSISVKFLDCDDVDVSCLVLFSVCCIMKKDEDLYVDFNLIDINGDFILYYVFFFDNDFVVEAESLVYYV